MWVRKDEGRYLEKLMESLNMFEKMADNAVESHSCSHVSYSPIRNMIVLYNPYFVLKNKVFFPEVLISFSMVKFQLYPFFFSLFANDTIILK